MLEHPVKKSIGEKEKQVKKGGKREVEKVDTLIDLLAENISEKIKKKNEKPGEIAEKAKALAELISARAQML